MVYTERLWSIEEVADLVGVKAATVRRWVKEGKVKARRIGRLLRIPSLEVRALTGICDA